MSANYNKLYNISIKNEKQIPATASYLSGQNVCLLAPQKAQMAEVCVSKLGIGVDASANYLDVSGNSLFRSVATFNTPPKCSTDPTNNEDLSNKGYVDFTTNLVQLDVDAVSLRTQFITSSLTSPPSNSWTKLGSKLDLDTYSLISNGVELTSTELGYLDGITSSVQTQLNTLNTNYSNAVLTSGNQTIGGVKTFSLVPVCSISATTANQLTNKTYVDNAVSSAGGSYVTTNTSQSITANKQFSNISIGKANTTNVFDVSGNINFDTPSLATTIQNNGFTAFTGFTAPTFDNPRTLLSNANNTTTLNNWTWTMGTQGLVYWSAGASDLEYYSSPPPAYSYFIFNTSYKGYTFYQQQTITLQKGHYELSWWSYWGGKTGTGEGSTTASISVSIGNSTDTYLYNDGSTRNTITWNYRTARFFVSTTGSTYIRWTPSDTTATGTAFRWAIGGITLKYFNTETLTDTNGLTSYLGGSLSYFNNLYANKLTLTGVLSYTGIPVFSSGGTNTNCLVLNSSNFNTTGTGNSGCVIIGSTIGLNADTFNRVVAIGGDIYSNISQPDTAVTQSVTIGNNIQGGRKKMIMIGEYVKCQNDTTGECVAIGFGIGTASNNETVDGTGCGRYTVAIGSQNFSYYNGFGTIPTSQPLECVAIGFLSQFSSADNYNTSVGAYSLQSINGDNGISNGVSQYNTAVGHQAGHLYGSMNKCVLIGAGAKTSADGVSNGTALGYNAQIGANFATAIGSGVSNSTADSIKIGRSIDTTYIDGGLVLASNSITMNGLRLYIANTNFLFSLTNISTLATNNTCFGYGSYSVSGTSASTNNSCFGSGSGGSMTSGRNNCLLGYFAGSAITTAISSTCMGFNAGFKITTGDQNTCYGTDTFNLLTTGSNNTAIGRQAGANCVTSTGCNFFGYNTTQDNTANTYTKSTALGTDAQITASNQIVIGTSTETTLITGKLRQVSMLANYADNSNLSTTQTLSKPFNQYYTVNISSSITITMPEITSATELGNSITFRLNGAPSTFTMSIIRQGTSNLVVPTGSATGQSTAYVALSSSKYRSTFVALKLGTNYGWFEM